jgi:hypothetical protein
LHVKFALGVESAGGFVEDQNRSVFENGAGDAEALFFAAAEAAATMADSRVMALRIFHNEVMSVGEAGGGFDSVDRSAKQQ